MPIDSSDLMQGTVRASWAAFFATFIVHWLTTKLPGTVDTGQVLLMAGTGFIAAGLLNIGYMLAHTSATMLSKRFGVFPGTLAVHAPMFLALLTYLGAIGGSSYLAHRLFMGLLIQAG